MFILIVFIGSTALAQAPVSVIPADNQIDWLETGTAEDQAAKRLVYDFWRIVLVARNMNAAMEYMDDSYVQHNPTIPSGRAPFILYVVKPSWTKLALI